MSSDATERPSVEASLGPSPSPATSTQGRAAVGPAGRDAAGRPSSGAKWKPDFDEEARKLFALLNLSPSGAADEESMRVHQYRNLDPVWRHPETGASVFIGNAAASSSREILRSCGITHVVNCTSDMKNVFEGKDPSITYFRFNIYRFMRELDLATHHGVLEFFQPVFDWVDEAVAGGNSVLIHCLAGAHRAGTTGVAYTMHAANLDSRTAIAAVQACRPIVDPISDLSNLLAQLDVAQRQAAARKSEAAANSADAAVGV